jgi:hypothetical protein
MVKQMKPEWLTLGETEGEVEGLPDGNLNGLALGQLCAR